MAVCEKCWNDAFDRMHSDPSKSQAEHYHDLLEERKDNPCDPSLPYEGKGAEETKELRKLIRETIGRVYDAKFPTTKQENDAEYCADILTEAIDAYASHFKLRSEKAEKKLFDFSHSLKITVLKTITCKEKIQSLRGKTQGC
jgi:hypothetical protein